MLLRHYLQRGLPKAEIGRELGISRRTVYHWIASGQLDREVDNALVCYRARPPVSHKIDPCVFQPIVDGRVSRS